MSALAERLAGFALGPVAQADAARAIMALSLMDWAACGIAGRDEPVARIVREMVAGEGGQGPASVIGGAHAPARGAALVNGAASHALDYDDTHFAHIGHPSVAVIPAALAAAETVGAGGADMLEAALIGAEVSVRIGLWLGRAHYQTGFHQTATAGAFGATAAAGRLIGLNAVQMQAAIGLAATRAAGLKSQFGTMGKPYHAGLAAGTGVEAAMLGLAGFDTRGAGLDGPQGFGPTHHGEGDETALDGMGTHWHMETVSHKFHACCHGLHAMLEALAEVDADPAAIARIEVRTHPRWLSVCNIAAPATGLETKFSYRLTAAMALSGHNTAALETYSDAAARDAGLIALRDRVAVVADETVAETASDVTVTLADGTALKTAHDLAAPLAIETRTARLRAKTAALVGPAGADTLWQATNAQRAPDMDALCRMLRG